MTARPQSFWTKFAQADLTSQKTFRKSGEIIMIPKVPARPQSFWTKFAQADLTSQKTFRKSGAHFKMSEGRKSKSCGTKDAKT